MEHRLRRKHPELLSDTFASNETYVKEMQERREEETIFQRKNKNRKKWKKDKWIHGSGVTLKWAFPNPSQSTEAQKTFFTQEKRHFKKKNFSTIFFRFWRLLGRLKRKIGKMKKKKNKERKKQSKKLKKMKKMKKMKKWKHEKNEKIARKKRKKKKRGKIHKRKKWKMRNLWTFPRKILDDFHVFFAESVFFPTKINNHFFGYVVFHRKSDKFYWTWNNNTHSTNDNQRTIFSASPTTIILLE